MLTTFMLLLIIYISLTFTITRWTYRYFLRQHWLVANYLGENVAQGFGLIIWVHFISFILIFSLLGNGISDGAARSLFVLVLTMFSLSILGWIDDYIGTQEIKGISGHVNVFIQQKRITTGLLKAAGGTVIALMVTFPIAQNLFHWLILTLLVMLSIHLYNLLDTRPGRSLKAFWLVLLPFIFIIGFVDSLFIFLPLIIATMIMFQYDRKRKAMLGDTGSNMLGGVIGFLMAYYAPFILQIVFLILLIGLSVVAEKHSFSAYIKRTPWLRKIDQWGLR